MAKESDLKTDLEALGLKDDAVDRIARLIQLNPTNEERKRWIEIRVLSEEGKIIIDEDPEKADFGLQICLFEMCYSGILTRTKRGGYINANQ